MYLLYLIKVLTQPSLVQSLCAAYCNYDKSLLASFKLKTGYIGKWVKLWISQLHHHVLFISFFCQCFSGLLMWRLLAAMCEMGLYSEDLCWCLHLAQQLTNEMSLFFFSWCECSNQEAQLLFVINKHKRPCYSQFSVYNWN